MTVPWIGFQLSELVKLAEPTSAARYVVFTTLADKATMPGLRQSWYPWPYTEGVTIEEAANEVGAVLAADPANLGAVQLMNRLEMERAAGRAASDADAAVANHRFEDAVAALLKVPADSVFHEQSARWLARLQPEIEKLRKKACRPGQSIDCIRLKALAAKLERAL